MAVDAHPSDRSRARELHLAFAIEMCVAKSQVQTHNGCLQAAISQCGWIVYYILFHYLIKVCRRPHITSISYIEKCMMEGEIFI